MKRKYFSIFMAALLMLSLILTGCGTPSHEEAAKAVLTRLYTYPNAELVEFEANLTDEDFELSADGRLQFMKPEVMEQENRILRDILGDEFDDAYAERLYGSFFTEMMQSSEKGYSLTPQKITINGENNQYSYTVTALYTDEKVTDSEETITGRIQFNDAGKINFISTDKVSYLSKR